jgi:predicted AAA+ superfamily ATPase
VTNGSVGPRTYIPRVVDHELDELLPSLAAISIEGIRGVGKTATGLRRAATTHRLDDPNQRSIIAADPARLTEGKRPVLIDEWQRLPESWDIVRRAVDDDPSAGQWILTGSAVPADQPTHSGAGRIVTLRMRPMTLAERGVATSTVSLADLLGGARPPIHGHTDVSLVTYAQEIVASGLPGVRRHTGRALRAHIDSYVARIVDRDFEELGGRELRNPVALQRWMAAYAAATSTTTTYEAIRDASTSGEGDKPARTTTRPYTDVLERLWVIDPLPAWQPTRSHITRLASPPKHHLADPALAASLLGASVESLLDAQPLGPPIPRDGPLLGHLFESLVTLDVRVFAQAAEARTKHLRTRGGRHEIDLIVERRDHRVVAIEVKLSRTVDDRDVRHLHWLAGQIGDDLLDAAIVTTGPDAYRREDGIAIIPAALLGP